MQFFVEENLVSWHPKTHGPRNYLQSFYLAANNAAGKYHLNLHVLGLNNYLTFAEIMKGYRSMAR